MLVTGVGGAILIGLAASHDELRHGLTNSTAHDQGDELLLIGVTSSAPRSPWSRPGSRSCCSKASGRAGPCPSAQAVARRGRRPGGGAGDRRRRGRRARSRLQRDRRIQGRRQRRHRHLASQQLRRREPLRALALGDRRERDGAADRHRRRHLRVLVGPRRRRYRGGPGRPLALPADAGRAGDRRPAALLGFLVAVLGGGTLAALRAGPERSLLAAALGGCVAFFLAAAVDWNWQMPALPVAALLLASTLRDGGARPRPEARHCCGACRCASGSRPGPWSWSSRSRSRSPRPA